MILFDLVKVIVLGVVEGVTEFLPISSTGHLVIVNQWLFFGENFTRIFDIVIQCGAVVAVMVYFRKQLFFYDGQNNQLRDVWLKVLCATAPAIIIGVLVGKSVQNTLFYPLIVAGALIIGGVAFIWIEKIKRHGTIDSIQHCTYLIAFTIGIIQCLAFIPGVSRSAATILGALLLGVHRKTATEFSFFLAIPTLLAAGGYSLITNPFSFTLYEMLLLCIGSGVSFLSAWFVIRIFMKYITTHNFEKFGYYRIGLGAVIIILLLFRGI